MSRWKSKMDRKRMGLQTERKRMIVPPYCFEESFIRPFVSFLNLFAIALKSHPFAILSRFQLCWQNYFSVYASMLEWGMLIIQVISMSNRTGPFWNSLYLSNQVCWGKLYLGACRGWWLAALLHLPLQRAYSLRKSKPGALTSFALEALQNFLRGSGFRSQSYNEYQIMPKTTQNPTVISAINPLHAPACTYLMPFSRFCWNMCWRALLIASAISSSLAKNWAKLKDQKQVQRGWQCGKMLEL